MSSEPAARLAVLVSGGGRSLENLAERIAAGELPCTIGLVLSDRPDVGALARAARLGFEAVVVDRRQCADAGEFSERVFAEIERRRCTHVVLAGFLRLLPLPEPWLGRVINIHPSLLPKYGGKGFYGDRVHAAVLAAGETQSGCTVHWVDNTYDTGPVLLQRTVPVEPNDTVETLATRVFEAEKLALPEAVRRMANGERP